MTAPVHIVETVRDAWQGLAAPVPTARKIAFIRRLVEAGVHHVDVGSFVSQRRVPAMADTGEVLAGLEDMQGAVFTALVASESGLDRLLAAPGVSEVLYPFSLSESFQRRNTERSREEAYQLLARLTKRAHEAGRTMYATISMAFGNNESDPFDPVELRGWVQRLHEAGVDRVALADTTAMASPGVIGEVYAAVMEGAAWPVPGAHLHVSPDNQEAMVGAALDAGCRTFDAALGGLGGCQFAKAAVSNVSTWPLVQQLESRGLVADMPGDPLSDLDAAARALAADLEE